MRRSIGDRTWLRSAVGERGKWSEERRGAPIGTKPQRNAAANFRRKLPLMRSVQRMQLVTSVWFEERNGRGREGEGADRQPVERSNPHAGHGAKGGVREGRESGRKTGADVQAHGATELK